MITNVVFDIGRVLIDYNPTGYLQSLGYTKEQIDLVNAAAFENEIWKEVDRGTYTFAQFIQSVCDENPEIEGLIREVFNENWFDVLVPFPDAVDFMAELKNEGFHIYLLSNFSPEGFDYVLKKYDFLHQVDGKVISGYINMIKPELEIYHYLLTTYQLKPEETLFFDDMPENIEAAKQVGMHGIVYHTLEDARKRFADLLRGEKN